MNCSLKQAHMCTHTPVAVWVVCMQGDSSDGHKYVSSLYFAVSTLATVGFGEWLLQD